jgi:hypothetical protein
MKYLVIILSLITIALWIRIGKLKSTNDFLDDKIDSLVDKYKSTETYQRITNEAKFHEKLKNKYNNLWEKCSLDDKYNNPYMDYPDNILNCSDCDLHETTKDCANYFKLSGKHLREEVFLLMQAQSYLKKQPDIKDLKEAQNQLKETNDGILVTVKLLAFLTVSLFLYMTYNSFLKNSK